MNQYKANDVAKMVAIYVNTVRLYEKYNLMGYQVFTHLHIEQFKLAHVALKVEILQNELRKQVHQNEE